jgi:Vacuolar sorting-associated protein 13, N-terminal
MPNTFLLSPFTLIMSINLKKSFNAQTDLYKYQINTLISQINLNLNPTMLRDILKFKAFLEMFSYTRDLKRYRPPIRIQAFVDSPAYTPAHKKKKQALIRDWFKLVLWYVRLRRAAKGATPFKLLEIEEAIQ